MPGTTFKPCAGCTTKMACKKAGKCKKKAGKAVKKVTARGSQKSY